MDTTAAADLETLTVVADLVARHAGCERDTLGPDTPIKSTGIDSIGVVELLFDLEERFDVSLSENDEIASRFDVGTVAELAAYIDERRVPSG